MTKKRKEKKEGKNAMRAIMLMFDTLARDFYQTTETIGSTRQTLNG